MLNSIEEIIEAIGGHDAAAKLAGVGRSAVSNWKARGMIPPEYWHAFAKALSLAKKKANPAVFFKTE